MPAFYRIVEVSVYALLNFLPLAVLALYLFRHTLRYSYRRIIAVLTLVSVLQIGIGIHVAFYPNAFVSIISLFSTLLYAIFFLHVVDGPVRKSLFILLFLSNIENYIVISSKCLEGQLFPDLARQQYRWSFSFSMLLVLLALAIPLYFYIRKVIVPVIEIRHTSNDWRYVWLVPAIFYFIWYYCTYLINEGSSLEMALRPRNTAVFTIFNLGAFLVYFVVSRLLQISERNRDLEQQSALAAIQLLQYQHLQEKIQETRRARHDLRHHVMVMNGYLKTREYAKLEAYLSNYAKDIFEESETLRMCENDTVNVILLYFSGQAERRGISFQANAALSESAAVSKTDLSVLFGNLLENALDACTDDESRQRQIIVKVRETASTLCITVDNTSHQPFKKAGNERFLSTKHAGDGIGLDSVRSIVERYNGTLQIEQDQDMVYVSVLLCL